MNTRMIEKYYAKRRRNRALIFSLVVHAILIIGIAVWLLKPLIEQIEDSIAVDFVQPQQQPRTPCPEKDRPGGETEPVYSRSPPFVAQQQGTRRHQGQQSHRLRRHRR